jgi:polygalacturonase
MITKLLSEKLNHFISLYVLYYICIMKIIKKILLPVFLITALSISVQAKVKTYKAPSGIVLSKDFRVTVNGLPIDLYFSETRYGSRASFGYFDFADSVKIEITTAKPAPHTTEWQILPEKYGIKYRELANGKIGFTLKNPAKLTFVVTGDYWGHTLHLFANAPETKAPTKDSPGVIYFGPGLHVIGSEKNNTITLESNQRVYIAGGAVVQGFIKAENAENIEISGRGILMQTPKMNRQRGIDIEACSNIKINGVILNRNRDGWTGFIYKSNKITITDLKVVSPAIWSTDGMNLANCSNATFSDCFFRAGDDNIAIKGLGNNRSHSTKTIAPASALPNENITIDKCIFWSDNNNAVVIGQETIAEYFKNIEIKNSDVIFVRDEEPEKAALAIISLHGTPMENITFDNIRVGSCGQLITVFNTENIFNIAGSQQWPGAIGNITFSNITSDKRGTKTIRIHGWSDKKPVHNVRLKNIVIRGDTLSQYSGYLDLNDYTKNIIIDSDTINNY